MRSVYAFSDESDRMLLRGVAHRGAGTERENGVIRAEVCIYKRRTGNCRAEVQAAHNAGYRQGSTGMISLVFRCP